MSLGPAPRDAMRARAEPVRHVPVTATVQEARMSNGKSRIVFDERAPNETRGR